MRFAPPNPLRIADRSSGLNSISVRSYNERLVLSLLLQNDGISRMEIGQRTGLSAQTVSVIVRSLEQEGLVKKGKAQKGRVGPPAIPLSLNAKGAYSVGISLGHRQTDVVLIDFVGAVKFHTTIPNSSRTEGSNHTQFLETVRAAIQALPSNRERIAGVGLAIPEDRYELNLAPYGAAERYETLGSEIEADLGVEVYVQNDISAAAGGESLFGAAKPLTDYLFCYLGARLHNRLVLNHQIFNSNAIQSHDVGLLYLQKRLEENGLDTSALWERGALWPDFGTVEADWFDTCVSQLEQSMTALSQFVPVTTIVLSSYAPKDICEKISKRLEDRMDGIRAIAGSLEVSPKAIGAASLPFSSKFMVE
ncbi:ROK family transcriptional regulator [Hoeflea prorocentri]|uniref:ROK family transcriptional regulator n=1 Tax=Hoeflea prorocentri TaxID=1922333 RepID=A0A9X3UKS4_9HYPH|nr:ROK family transcriptional regulator [Hoeflea prorocentri]MCY6382464.1 ROK family transcriptional regulator [Hoeflea prorocentri]MDA5400264.1 ROK family transcriptional regulator [Hoeflea prorocentri]